MPARQTILWSLLSALIILLFQVDSAFSAIEFSICNPIQTGEEVEVEVKVTGLGSTSCTEGKCYLQGLFTQVDQTQYFGLTANHLGEWYEYISTPEVELIKSKFFAFQPIDSSWSGKLKVKNNPSDSDYKGPGSYSLIFRRYSGKSTSHAGESNALVVPLSFVLPTPTPFASPKPSEGGSPTPTPTSIPSPTAGPTPTPIAPASPAGGSPSPSSNIQNLKSTGSVDILGTSSSFLDMDLLASGSATFSSTLIASQGAVIASASAAISTSKFLLLVISGGTLLSGSVVSWAWKRYNSGLLWPFKKPSN